VTRYAATLTGERSAVLIVCVESIGAPSVKLRLSAEVDSKNTANTVTTIVFITFFIKYLSGDSVPCEHAFPSHGLFDPDVIYITISDVFVYFGIIIDL
jgi:hypothetical protein